MKGHIFFRLALPALVLVFFTAATLHAQCISGNCRTGTGTFRFNNGDEYSGSWLSGQPNGKGTYRFISGERYEGGFDKGKFNGTGTMYYTDGGKYTGGWQQNKKHGNGTITNGRGAVVQRGQWNMGDYAGESTAAAPANKPKPNPNAGKPTANTGKPTSTTPSKPTNKPTPPPVVQNNTGTPRSKSDVGSLINCNKVYCAQGRGYFDYPDGSRWIGDMRTGQPAGNGVCFYANGDRYEGQWANNAPNGRGIMYFASGRVYGAIWAAGAPVRETDSDEVVPSDPVKIEASTNVKIYAVVVGVGQYTAMPALKFPDDDAFRFYTFLKSPEGGALPDSQVEVLTDQDATRDNILAAMRRMFLKADKNDVVVFYYSGHGLEGCFLPVDFDGYNNKLRHDEVKAIFNQSNAKHKLCIADACHSGSLNLGEGLVAKGPAPVSTNRLYQAFEDTDGGIALLMSSKSEELSLEDHGLRQGVFTYYLLQGLRGKADNNGDYIVTIKELYYFVHGRVREYTSGMQTPVLTGTYDDMMPVSLRPK
jgi:hypothetical protein